MACTITATEFKAYFDRGQFDYGTVLPEIRDKDIDQAIAEALAVFNQDLFATDEEDECKQALYYLTAHFLTNDVEAGASGGKSIFNQSSRSADGISESLAIPEWMLQGDFAPYATTYYGQKYLMLINPRLGGVVFAVAGATHP